MPIDRTRTRPSTVVTGIGVGTATQYGSRSAGLTVMEVPADVRAEVDTPTASLSGDLTLTYRLFALGQGSAPTASVDVEWSKDSGGTWAAITLAPSSNALTGRTTSAAGTEHTCVWDTIADVGMDFNGPVLVRVRSNDGVAWYFWRESDVFTVNNAPAQPTLYTPPSGAEKDTTPLRYGAMPTNPGARVVGDQVLKVEWDVAKLLGSDAPAETTEYRLRASSVDNGFDYSTTNRTAETWAAAAAAAYAAYPKNFLVSSRGADDNKKLRCEEDSAARVATVTIPDQADVTGATLATAIKTALDGDATLLGTYTVTYNTSTGKFTISVSGGAATFSLKTQLSTMDGTIGLAKNGAEAASWTSDTDVHGGLPWWGHSSWFRFTVQAADALDNQETDHHWWASAGE